MAMKKEAGSPKRGGGQQPPVVSGHRAAGSSPRGKPHPARPLRLSDKDGPVVLRGARERGDDVNPAKGFVRKSARKGGAMKESGKESFFRVPLYEPQRRVDLIRQGVSARVIPEMADRMMVTKGLIYSSLGLPRSTIDRQIAKKGVLSSEHTERVLGLQTLVQLADRIVEESGDPTNFNAEAWIGEWLDRPQPALGGVRPADYMDTMEGQRLVQSLLLRAQAGTYA